MSVDQIILFDGVCNLCNAAVKFVIPRDHKAAIRFAALQSDSGQIILGDLGLSTTDFDSFIYIKDGKALIKSTAALTVLKDLGGLWAVLYGFILVPKFIRDWVYDGVARSRYQIFGRTDACMIPTPELKARFL